MTNEGVFEKGMNIFPLKEKNIKQYGLIKIIADVMYVMTVVRSVLSSVQVNAQNVIVIIGCG